MHGLMQATTIFTGGTPEVASGPDGRILATGARARPAAGPAAREVAIRGRVLPGLHDAHLHLQGLVEGRLGLDLTTARSLDDAVVRVRRFAARQPAGAWILGGGWYSAGWPGRREPDRDVLDRAVAGRPALLLRRDAHSAWV
ncbi:MAG: amidohydrolase family protein, partial [Candidatus Dormiibacterota bacterium]